MEDKKVSQLDSGIPNRTDYVLFVDVDGVVTKKSTVEELGTAVSAGRAIYVDDSAAGDGTTDDQAVIQAAIDAMSSAGGGSVYFGPKTYAVGSKLLWKNGVRLIGVAGYTVLRLTDGANTTLLETDGYDTWEAWSSGSLAGYPMELFIDGIILDGNAENQGSVSTSLGNLVYGLRTLSHRISIGWLVVRAVKGVGIHTNYNPAIGAELRTTGANAYGFQGHQQGNNAPHYFGQIAVQDCLFEHFVFSGPSDIPINSLTTNYCGLLEGSIPSTPETSLLFDGEEIHSFRAETACLLHHANLNDAIFGRALYVAQNTRFHGGTVIASSSWGAVLIDSASYGSIANLVLQQNKYVYSSEYKPMLECAPQIGGALQGKFSFPQVTIRRIGSDPDGIGPAIYDDHGHQFGIIDWMDNGSRAGHGLVLGANNDGGSYESVHVLQANGTAGDATDSAAILIEDGAEDWTIGDVRLVRCDRGIVNLGANTRGVIKSGLIEVNTSGDSGQVALEGVVLDSQLAVGNGGSGAVVVDSHYLRLEYIRRCKFIIRDDGNYYYPEFREQISFDGDTAGLQSAARDHNMWREPAYEDVSVSWRWGGSVWPNASVGIRTLDASQVRLAAYVHTTSTGSITAAVQIQ